MYICAPNNPKEHFVMNRLTLLLVASLLFGACGNRKNDNTMEVPTNQELLKARGFRTDIPLDSIRLSDPCIMADKATGMYYMTGTGGRMWRSRDLAR